MAVRDMELPPLFVDATEIHADPIRSALSAVLGDQVGTFDRIDFGGTVNPDYTITVAPGRAALPTPVPDYPGVFLAESRTSVALPITPPHATRDRIDVVLAYAVPPATAQDKGKWCLEVRAGEPGTQPVPPTITGAMQLHELRVYSEADGRAIQHTDVRMSRNQLYAGLPTYGNVRPTNPTPGAVFTGATSRTTSVYVDGGEWVRVTPTQPIGVHVTQAGNVILNDLQPVSWTTASYNPSGMWSTQNPTRVIVPETGLYAYSATFAASAIQGATQLYKTAAVAVKYTAEVGGTAEILGGQDGAGWGAAGTRTAYFSANGTVKIDKGQSLGVLIETAVQGLKTAYTSRLSVWKLL